MNWAKTSVNEESFYQKAQSFKNKREFLQLFENSLNKATGNFTAGDVKLKCAGGSTVQMAGTANDLTCGASDSSLLKMDAFALRNAKVTLSGENAAAIKPSGKLDVELSKASKLTYYGDPVLGETQITGGSTMTRK